MLRSFDTDDEATDFVHRIVLRMNPANMSLGKLKSNSTAVLHRLGDSRGSPACVGLARADLLRVLGVAWAPAADIFTYQPSSVASVSDGNPNITEREVLRIVATIFDSAGWAIPFPVRELLIQKLWSEDLRWDDPVTVRCINRSSTGSEESEAVAIRHSSVLESPASGSHRVPFTCTR